MISCATPQQLERLIHDQLDDPQRETIVVHVQHCVTCQQVLEQLTRETADRARSAADPSQTHPETDLLQLLKVQGPLVEEDATNRPSHRPVPTPGAYPSIAGFRILREIGRGGMGVVYEAEQEVLSRRVALKVLPAHSLIHPTQIQRFEREAKTAARLHHTNIVPVFGVGEQDGSHYYVMQYIEGSGLDIVVAELRRRHGDGPGAAGTAGPAPAPNRSHSQVGHPGGSRVDPGELARSLVRGRFHQPEASDEDRNPAEPEPAPGTGTGPTLIQPSDDTPPPLPPTDPPSSTVPGTTATSGFDRPFFEEIARIGLLAADALEYAHWQGILHRDIKPSNLLLDLRGNVWITDFGLAKTPGDDDLTETGDVVGTIRYLAPERFEGLCDPRSEVYSLGLTLYELVSLRPAYDALDRYRLIDRVRRAEPPRLGTRVPRIPLDLETIIQKAIAREPARRYARSADLAADLRRFLEGRPIQARRVSPPERFARWCRRNPGVAGLSAAVFASLMLGFIFSTVQAIRATVAEAAARLQRDRAETEAKISKAVQEFLQRDLLAQASAYNQSTLRTRPDPDLKVRTALDRAARTIGDRFAGQPLVEASIRLTVGDTYSELGLYREALPHLQRALDLRRSVLGPDHPDTFLAMKSLGSLYLADQKLAEAEPLLVGAMRGLEKARSSGDPELLHAVANVAQLDYLQGKHAEAEELLTRARKEHLAARGEDDPTTLDVTASLGLVLIEQGKAELAERTLADVLDRSRRSLGPEHPLTLTAKQCLADAYLFRKKTNDGLRLLTEVIEAETRVLGRNHPDTLAAMVKVGIYCFSLGDHDRAESLLTEALVGCRTALDRNHDTTDGALAGLANVYLQKGDMKQVARVLMEAAEIKRLRWGPDSEYAITANEAAGGFLLIQREYVRAEPYFRDGLSAWAKSGPSRRDRFFDELALGVCLLGQKKYPEARSHFLIGYNGLRPDRDETPSMDRADLGWLIEQVAQLRDEEGRRLINTTMLSILLRDPELLAIVLDLQFPADLFAPP
jgi:eukaryotic-like serine/threonine-protein kinase